MHSIDKNKIIITATIICYLLITMELSMHDNLLDESILCGVLDADLFITLVIHDDNDDDVP